MALPSRLSEDGAFSSNGADRSPTGDLVGNVRFATLFTLCFFFAGAPVETPPSRRHSHVCFRPMQRQARGSKLSLKIAEHGSTTMRLLQRIDLILRATSTRISLGSSLARTQTTCVNRGFTHKLPVLLRWRCLKDAAPARFLCDLHRIGARTSAASPPVLAGLRLFFFFFFVPQIRHIVGSLRLSYTSRSRLCSLSRLLSRSSSTECEPLLVALESRGTGAYSL